MKIVLPFLVALSVFVSVFSPAVFAADEAVLADIQTKLTQVLDNQKQILSRLDEMKQELYIVKVRASR
jgi:Na+-transporting NADH:ubiquinone oxidoreductase subunit NqrC